MARETALGYVLDDDGKLIDAFIQCETGSDPAPTQVEKEIVRIIKEYRELRAEKKVYGVGDLLLLDDGSLWEIIGDTHDDDGDGHTLNPGVTFEDGRYIREGKIISYAVRGFTRRDYHEIVPNEIEKAWRLSPVKYLEKAPAAKSRKKA